MSAYLIYCVYKIRIGVGINTPKTLFYGSTLITNFIIHLDPLMPMMLIIVMETIYHDVQYYGWIMHYQNKILKPMDKNVIVKWLVYSLVYSVFMTSVIYFNFLGSLVVIVEPVFLSLILFHYISDGYIWKFSRDKELRVLLA